MNHHEAKKMEDRTAQFRALETRSNQIRCAISHLSLEDPTAPCRASPFTGNTRESRRIKVLNIEFTSTRGGGPPVSREIGDLLIPAWEFARQLEVILKAQLELVTAEMEKI